MSNRTAQKFGGDWTKKKLGILREYLQAYRNALKRQSFELWYVDAFAGSGFIDDAPTIPGNDGLLPGMGAAPEEPYKPLEGSARMALKVSPPFHKYVFVDKKKSNVLNLARLREEFPALASRIDIAREDCNKYVQALCRQTDWSNTRAVIFLDPFGMQVDWATMEAIASTRAVDVWTLVPVGSGLGRLLRRDGMVPDSWRVRLEKVLGTRGWREELYRERSSTGLYGEEKRTERVSIEEIASYYLKRLRGIFAGVHENPPVLRGSKNVPLFHLYFAVSNPRAVALATRIAASITKGKHDGR